MRKKLILMTVLILTVLTGCKGNLEEPGDVGETEAGVQEELPLEYRKSDSVVLEDEEAVYLCGASEIRKMDKDSREVTVLWESETDKPNMYTYAYGKALLVDDKIYFVECVSDVYQENDVLSVINTDGTGYEKVEELENSVQAMYHQDQAVYVYFYQNDMRAYEIGKEGELSFSEALTESTPYKVPEGYRLIRGLTPFESVENYGYILLENKDLKLVMIDPRTGEEKRSIENDIEAMNQDYFLFSVYNDEENCKELYVRDAQTLETKLLAQLDSEGNDSVVGMDEDFVYLVRQEDRSKIDTDYIYDKIALDNGGRSGLFTISAGTGVQYYTPYYVMDFTVCNGYLYYIDDKDYAMYLMRRKIENPDEEETLGGPYFDRGIGKVGELEAHYEEIYSQVKPEIVLGEVALQRIIVDEKFAGAPEINRVLSDYQEECISYEKNSIEWMDEELEENGDAFLEGKPWYSYSSNPSEITYFDGDYFSFFQRDHDYMGGAHGMPFWIGFTFDLETGDKLILTDIIGNTEEELKELVTEYFAQYIGENPEMFWEDALETVKEGISLDSDFYLSEEGIHFYFGPYALACYAAGFQDVTIPYEEFDMKLPIGRKEAEEVKTDDGNPSDEENEKKDENLADLTTVSHDVDGRKLPIYCVDTQEKKIALTFDAACGGGNLR